MDITPFVGIVGAVVGGGIGLFGQRMNLREQRRKDLRERVAEFLREVDLLVLNSDRFRLAALGSDRSRVLELIPELRHLVSQAHHNAQYLDLTAPWMLQQYVRDVWYAADGVHTASLDFWYAGAAGAQLEANYTTAKGDIVDPRGVGPARASEYQRHAVVDAPPLPWRGGAMAEVAWAPRHEPVLSAPASLPGWLQHSR